MIDGPQHYGGKDNPYEAIKVIKDWGLGFNLGNTLKYILRAEHKGTPTIDLRQSLWYLDDAHADQTFLVFPRAYYKLGWAEVAQAHQLNETLTVILRNIASIRCPEGYRDAETVRKENSERLTYCRGLLKGYINISEFRSPALEEGGLRYGKKELVACVKSLINNDQVEWAIQQLKTESRLQAVDGTHQADNRSRIYSDLSVILEAL